MNSPIIVEILQEHRDSLRLQQKEIAELMQTTPKTVSLLMNGKARITVRLAKGLSVALGKSAEFWLNLQRDWDLKDA